MLQLQKPQLLLLLLPIALIAIFLLIAAGIQIHTWHLSWIWAIFTMFFVGWRWLLVKWTSPAIAQFEAIAAEVTQELEAATHANQTAQTKQAETILQSILIAAKTDAPIWEDWQTFWQRCLDLLKAIAEIYHPEVKYPVLNIYIPQAYSLMRGTVDDLDQWMQKLSPALSQVSLAQAYQAYEVYQRLEPSARKVLQAWSWAQWLLNPVTAIARRASQRYTNQANQQLLVNLGSLMREAALRNLCRQAIALYGGTNLPSDFGTSAPVVAQITPQTKSLQDLLAQAEPPESLDQKPLKILLAGRTGAGKSSLINALFQAKLAAVDVLPSTDQIQSYHWQINQAGLSETLELLDTPGYEQVNRSDFRQRVLDYAIHADLLLLATPALDPALQMDVDFLTAVQAIAPNLPTIAVVTQVDRLRPLKEWTPPYDWQWGDRQKEVSIREATEYRLQSLGEQCDRVFPVATPGEILDATDATEKFNRIGWGIDALSVGLIEAIAPTQQIRLGRFLQNLEARAIAAAKIIDHYSLQMTTTQGVTMLIKSPVLQFISTLSTGSPALAFILADRIPVEQLPVVISKLQMAYDLHGLLKPEQSMKFDLVPLWSLFLDQSAPADRSAWALGHALVEHWTQGIGADEVRDRMMHYLES